MNNLNPLQSLIVGLGNIGLEYDYEYDSNDIILSHAKAFALHPQFNLAAAVDSNPDRCHRFETRYQVPTFQSLCQVTIPQFDVIALAVPTDQHYIEFKNCLALKPRLLLCEKPLSFSFEEARSMVIEANQHQCYLLPNYIRRFEPGLVELKNYIKTNPIGHIKWVSAVYSKGLFAVGCHLLDTVCFLFDSSAQQIKVRQARQYENEVLADLAFFLDEIEVNVKFVPLDYHHLSLTLYGENGKIEYSGDGSDIQCYSSQTHPLFKKAKQLQLIHSIPCQLNKYQYFVLDYIEKLLLSPFDLKFNEAQLHSQILLNEIQCVK